MGVQNFSSDVRGFLYGLFNEASKVFEYKAKQLGPAEAQIARDLSFDFMRAQGEARMGTLADFNAQADALVKTLNGLTDPGLKDALDELRDRQKLMYRHLKPQEKIDLGTYSNGIF